jgi:TonB family protein
MQSRQLLSLILALAVSPAAVVSQEARGSTEPTVVAEAARSNTTEGLNEVLVEMRAAARNGNENELAALLKQTEIPDCDAWLHKMYDSEKADSWMELCEPTALGAKEAAMRESFKRFANADGRFVTRSVNQNPQPGRGLEWGMLQAGKQPLDIYWAGWLPASESNEAKAEPVGYFMFIDGNFRWDSIIQFMSLRRLEQGNSARAADTPPNSVQMTVPAPEGGLDLTRVRVGGNVMMRKLIHRAQLVYPPDARSRHISGTVVLHVIVASKGSVETVDVVSGANELRQAAVDCVKQWRFSPTLIDGKPVEVDTTIQIIFTIG